MGGMTPRIQISLRGLLLVVTFLAFVLGGYSAFRNRLGRPSSYAGVGAPLATGALHHVTLWDKPVGAGSNEGSTPPMGSRVEVYEHFILVTPPNGPTRLSPHGWYSGLKFNRDGTP